MDNPFTTPRLAELLPAIKAFIVEELYPLEQQALSTGFYELQPVLDEKRAKVKALGWWLPQVPQKWGGMGLSLLEFGILSEYLAKTLYGHYIFNCQAPDAGNMEILMEHASEDQQERFLKPLLNGDIRSCFAMTEPEFAGSNPIQMGARGTLSDGSYRVTGHKWYTTGADGASFAVVMCLTDPDHTNPYQRASQIIVPTDTPGFQLLRNIPVMGERGEGWLSHGEVMFDCVVPQDHLLGEAGSGFAMAQERLGPGRIHHCMRWIGISERALELLCHRAATRSLGQGKLLAHKQSVQNWIAESRAEIDAARLMVLNTARRIDAEGAYAARIDVSVIKFFVANVLQQVLDRAIQAHGGLGMCDDLPLAFWFRHERAARIYDGADEVHKERVAKYILKDYLPDTKNSHG
ncbi:MAG: acyl-CoA dehydrogenase family protein [Saprospiraceae bacterium]|nr:acyl-CoA dehydrogenase family protein [Saprospiraceae bacterium]